MNEVVSHPDTPSMLFDRARIERALVAAQYNETKHLLLYVEIIENEETDVATRLKAMQALERYMERAEQRNLMVLSRKTTRTETTDQDGKRTVTETLVDRMAAAFNMNKPTDLINTHVKEARPLGEPDDDDDQSE